jgi:L-amino acid N-acyltransferase YncA
MSTTSWGFEKYAEYPASIDDTLSHRSRPCILRWSESDPRRVELRSRAGSHVDDRHRRADLWGFEPVEHALRCRHPRDHPATVRRWRPSFEDDAKPREVHPNRLNRRARDARRVLPFVFHDAVDDVVGWSSLNKVSVRPSYPVIAEVSVYVDETHRSKTVGARLFIHLLDAAKERGLRSLVSHAFEKNAPSTRGLIAAGFRPKACLGEEAFIRDS